ncbi:MAG TPA: permease-like cell division protein FtsX [Ferruginibacter sp.]|jgi:cell division transport system permease protein|nr:permease-like cell division protein FtsX [Ferruginibacter sp.]
MSQFGKGSSKKGKTTYAYAIIGVALVLFLFGIVGWFFIDVRKTGDYLKESIQIQAFLNRDASKTEIDSLQQYVAAVPYVKSAEYVTKEMAIQRYNADNDTSWRKFIANNPLPESIDFNVKADHVQADSLNALAENLQNAFPGVISEFKFPTVAVDKVSKYVKAGALVFLIIAVILTMLVIISIDNTIRLAMYSNRFLIKTMQMVGATRWFIAKPIDVRAIVNGLISALLAIIAVYSTVLVVEYFVPDFKSLHDTKSMAILFIGIIILGIIISVFSTHRAVLKYLRMKLDDLY